MFLYVKIYKFIVAKKKRANGRGFGKQSVSEGLTFEGDGKKREIDRDDDEERRRIYTRTTQEVVSACAAICNALRFA